MWQEVRKVAWWRLAALLGTLALLASGCTIGQSTCTGSACPPKRAKEQVFHGMLFTGGGNDITTLDPDVVTDTSSLEVVNTLYDGLVTLDRNLNVELWGAKEIDVSADGLTYVFHLRSGQFFADGTPVLPSDYAYSMNRSLNPCVASVVAYYLYPIKDAQTFNFETCHNGQISAAQGQSGSVIQTLIGDSLVPDDVAGTLTVKLAQPMAYFLASLTYSASYALEPSVIGSDITSERWTDTLSQGSPTGQGTSGMFYLAHWDHLVGGQLVLKANPHWWGIAAGKKPSLTEIDWTLFKDGASAYAAYKAGQYDMAFVTSDQVTQAQGRQDERAVALLTVSAVVTNWAMPPFDNLDARLAFCLAIDRDALGAAVSPGAQVPSWHIVPQGMPGYNPDLTGPDGVTSTRGDSDKARAHWQAYLRTLHGAQVPEIDYLYYPLSPRTLKQGQVLQQQWQAILGVHVALSAYQGILLKTPPPFQLQGYDWAADYPDPQDFLSLLLLPGSQYNVQSANVPAANLLMRAADANPDQQERLQQYQQAEQLLVNQVAWCPIAQAVDHYLLRSYVRNWSVEAEGVPPNDAWVATFITSH